MNFVSKVGIILLFQLQLFNLYSQTWSNLPNAAVGEIITTNYYNGKLVVGGGLMIGTTNGMGTWDGTSWDSIGNGTSYGMVKCFAEYNNELIAGGTFSKIGSNLSNVVPNTKLIAAWNGSQWHNLGSGGSTGYVNALAVYNGELYVGGNFITMGGISCQRIARWNGSTWNTVGGGVTGSMPEVYTMCVYDGWLYVGGSFQMAGGVPVNQIAKWNGLQWDSVGPGVNGYSPLSMIVDTLHNNLIISGNFACANPAFGNCICAWNGVNYLPFGQGLQLGARALAFYKNYLFTTKPSVSGAFTDTTLLYWDSTSWRPVSGPNNDIHTLIGYNNELYVGGPFTQIDSMSIPYFARFSFPSIGIKELKFKNSSLMIYPNPSEGSVNLTYYFNNPTKEIMLRIFDISGKIVLIKKFSRPTGNYCIGHGTLPSGLYIAKIQNNIEKMTQKFIIE